MVQSLRGALGMVDETLTVALYLRCFNKVIVLITTALALSAEDEEFRGISHQIKDFDRSLF